MTEPALFDRYRQAEALLNSGDIRKSADLCKQILDADPDFAHGYHLMAALFKSTGNLDKALTFAQMALSRQPAISAFHLRLGQVWYSLQRWSQAAIAFETAHLLDPDDPFPLVLWADALAQEGRFDEALILFARARKLNESPETDEYEGMCLMMKGDLAGAEYCFNRLLAQCPDLYSGYIHKAKLQAVRKYDVLAEELFLKALRLKPDAYEALHGMALLCERGNRLDMAMAYAMQAIGANPRGWNSHAMLGCLLLNQNHVSAAEEVLKQAHGFNPGNIYILQLLESAYLRQGKQGEAMATVERLIKANAQDEVAQYMHAMMMGRPTQGPPREYISRLFDDYAERYDYHLQQVQAYKAPQRIAETIRFLPRAHSKLSVLDLGCGTGLLGEALRDMTEVRVGIDLSDKMLTHARARQLYSELYALDVVEFMMGSDRPFDLVVGADVSIYLGNLSPFMNTARNVLSSGSFLVFTIEKINGADEYRLQPSGRYTHSVSYVLRIAEENGYVPVKQQDIVLRTENSTPVDGALFVFKKAVTH